MNYAGTSLITKASGTRRVVLARYARNRRLADACQLWAFASLTASPAPGRSTTNGGRPATPTTGRCAPLRTDSLASCTAASDTASSTTKTPPGLTELSRPLDSYDPRDV